MSATRRHSSHRTPVGDIRGRMALVADGSAHTAELFARTLRRAGVGVLVADSCPTAIDHLRICRFDLVLLELELPFGRAYRVLNHMRTDPRHADARAIVVAARHDTPERWMAMLSGAAAFLTKPVPAPLLLETASTLLPYRPRIGLAIA